MQRVPGRRVLGQFQRMAGNAQYFTAGTGPMARTPGPLAQSPLAANALTLTTFEQHAPFTNNPAYAEAIKMYNERAAKANLPDTVFEALSTTSEGVMALYRMMEKGEPAVTRKADAAPATDEVALREMMRDPNFALRASTALGYKLPYWPAQYLRAQP